VIRVRWTSQAIEDVQSIRSFIGRDSPKYAALIVERIVTAVDILERFPLSGRIVPELAQDDVRELIRPPYRIVYRVVGQDVHIATVFRSSRVIPEVP
jgi:addiction module RelE/StbE family toxin